MDDDIETDDRGRADEQHPGDDVGSDDRRRRARREDSRGQSRDVEQCQ